MKFKIEVKKTETTEIDFPIPSYWKIEHMHYQISEDGIMVVGNAMVYWQPRKGSFFSSEYDSEINRMIKEGKQISKEDFNHHLKKTISNIKSNYLS